MIILDTDHISVLQHEDSRKAIALLEKLESLSSEEVATTAVTLEEQSRSWLSLIGRYTDVRQQVAYYDRLMVQDGHSGHGRTRWSQVECVRMEPWSQMELSRWSLLRSASATEGPRIPADPFSARSRRRGVRRNKRSYR